jgi:hypothetical protein
MKKYITTLALTTALFGLSNVFVYADTVDSTGGGGDCYTVTVPGGDIDTVTCFMSHTVTVYNNPAPAGSPVTITVSHDAGDLDGFTAFNMIKCTTSGVTGQCVATDVTSAVTGNGTPWGTVGRGASGSVAPSLSAGSYTISLTNKPKGGDSQSCEFAGGTCSLTQIPTQDITSGGTLVVESAPPASVLLQISGFFEKSFYKTLAFFGVIDSAYAEGL